MTGYLDHRYAESLSEFGDPLVLERSGGALLSREIPAAGRHDAMGTYPLLACTDWGQLHFDLADLTQLVSVVAVIDPFGNWTMEHLRTAFPDHLVLYKRHWIVDLSGEPLQRASRHHRYYARHAAAKLTVDVVDQPLTQLDRWCALYQTLTQRHRLHGIKAFSRSAFELQLQIPGLTVFRVIHRTETIGLQLWYTMGEVAYSHLTAFSDEAYRLRAAYAVYGFAIEHFCTRVRWLDLGGTAGAGRVPAQDGLDAFKKGWASGQRDAWLGGRIIDARAYADLARRVSLPDGYFPSYRNGELT